MSSTKQGERGHVRARSEARDGLGRFTVADAPANLCAPGPHIRSSSSSLGSGRSAWSMEPARQRCVDSINDIVVLIKSTSWVGNEGGGGRGRRSASVQPALHSATRLPGRSPGWEPVQPERSPSTVSTGEPHRAAAAQLGRALGLDRAQISRTLKRFAIRGLVETHDDPAHGRQQLLSLTGDGAAAFAALDANTRMAVGSLLEALPPIRLTIRSGATLSGRLGRWRSDRVAR